MKIQGHHLIHCPDCSEEWAVVLQCFLLKSCDTIIRVYGYNRKLSPRHLLTSSQGFTKKIDPCRCWAPRSGPEHSLYGFLQISSSPLPSAFIVVEIKGPTQHFIKKKSMQITKAENPVFVQTDKPIYKPGQSGIKNSLGKSSYRVGWRVGFGVVLYN